MGFDRQTVNWVNESDVNEDTAADIKEIVFRLRDISGLISKKLPAEKKIKNKILGNIRDAINSINQVTK
jgi:hypothetical protein